MSAVQPKKDSHDQHHHHGHDKHPELEPPNFSWLTKGELAACAFPDKVEHLQYLVNHGVGSLVTLTGEKQVDRQYITEDKLKIVWVPIRDFTPPTMDQVEQFIDTVLKTKAHHKATCVHCAHGLGRTGTMLSCYFVQTAKMTADEAIANVRKLRPGSVETPEQELLVHQFYDHIHKKANKS